MGLEVALVSIAGIATAAKMTTEAAAASEKEKALALQAKEQQLAFQQKSLTNYDLVQKTLDAQEAAMTVRGVGLDSPSFNAIQRQTINIGAKEAANTKIEKSIAESNLETEKANVKNSLFASIFGDVADTSLAAASLYTKSPKAVTETLPQMEAS